MNRSLPLWVEGHTIAHLYHLSADIISKLFSIPSRKHWWVTSYLIVKEHNKCFSLTDMCFEFQDHPVDVCRTFSALGKEHCSKEVEYHYSLQEQPEWISDDRILDAIVSYVPFEDLGLLSLTSRKIRSSVLRQLNNMLHQANWNWIWRKVQRCSSLLIRPQWFYWRTTWWWAFYRYAADWVV